jgi:hypothetical protein
VPSRPPAGLPGFEGSRPRSRVHRGGKIVHIRDISFRFAFFTSRHHRPRDITPLHGDQLFGGNRSGFPQTGGADPGHQDDSREDCDPNSRTLFHSHETVFPAPGPPAQHGSRGSTPVCLLTPPGGGRQVSKKLVINFESRGFNWRQKDTNPGTRVASRASRFRRFPCLRIFG